MTAQEFLDRMKSGYDFTIGKGEAMGFFDLGKGIIAKLHGEKVVLPSRLHEKDLVVPALYADDAVYNGSLSQVYSTGEGILSAAHQQNLKKIWEQQWLGGYDVDYGYGTAASQLTVTAPSSDWKFVTTTAPHTNGVQLDQSGWIEIVNQPINQPTPTVIGGLTYRFDGRDWVPDEQAPAEPEAPAETHVAPRRAMDLE